jgi:hypothetical protein
LKAWEAELVFSRLWLAEIKSAFSKANPPDATHKRGPSRAQVKVSQDARATAHPESTSATTGENVLRGTLVGGMAKAPHTKKIEVKSRCSAFLPPFNQSA